MQIIELPSLSLLLRQLKAKSSGYPLSIPEALDRMQARGIWLSQSVIQFALKIGKSK